jgi:hypothetical protein
MNVGVGAFVTFMPEIFPELRCNGDIHSINSVVVCFLEICLLV